VTITPIKPEMLSVSPYHRTNKSRVGVLELQARMEMYQCHNGGQMADITRQAAAPLEDALALDNGWLLRHTREGLGATCGTKSISASLRWQPGCIPRMGGRKCLRRRAEKRCRMCCSMQLNV